MVEPRWGSRASGYFSWGAMRDPRLCYKTPLGLASSILDLRLRNKTHDFQIQCNTEVLTAQANTQAANAVLLDDFYLPVYWLEISRARSANCNNSGASSTRQASAAVVSPRNTRN